MSAILVDALRLTYPAKRGQPERESLKGVSFEVERGEAFGLLGPNGGGKTTLFKILATALKPTAGRAEVLGFDVALAAADLRPKLGIVFQNPSLDGRLTVRENISWQGRLYGLCGAPLKERVSEMLERYGLAARADDLALTLSGGLKRRVELAKSLLHRPELLLLDEPSTGLDPAARKALWEHLFELQKQLGLTMLLTTHLMDEADRCRRLAILDEGRLAASGTPDALKGEIGGDVISISSREPETLRARIKEKFGVDAACVEETLRLERPEGHVFIPQLVEAFPGLISSVSLSKPTLEDVFVHHTGRRFGSAEERIA